MKSSNFKKIIAVFFSLIFVFMTAVPVFSAENEFYVTEDSEYPLPSGSFVQGKAYPLKGVVHCVTPISFVSVMVYDARAITDHGIYREGQRVR